MIRHLLLSVGSKLARISSTNVDDCEGSQEGEGGQGGYAVLTQVKFLEIGEGVKTLNGSD